MLSREPEVPEIDHPGDEDWRVAHETRNLRRRAAAAMIDIIVLGLAFALFARIFGHTVHYKVLIGTPGHLVPRTKTNLLGLPLIGYFLGCFLYFIILEWRLRWTIGKLILSLRVVTLDEERITLKQSLIRNLMRIIDGIPFVFPYMFGFSSVLGTRLHQRWGDRLARTIVIDSV